MNQELRTNLDYLLTELKRIELKLHQQVARLRTESGRTGEGSSRGLFISENEVDTLVGSNSFISSENLSILDNSVGQPLAELIEEIKTTVTEAKRADFNEGNLFRLQILEHLFKLSRFEIDALLICLLPELDSRYQKLYGYLQDDITQKSPAIDLVMNLLCESFEQRLLARQAFLPRAPLMKYYLLKLRDDHNTGKSPLVVNSLQIDERITDYLLGIDKVDVRLLPFTHLTQPRYRLEDVILPDDTKSRLLKLVARSKKESMVIYFQGGKGVGKHTTANAICNELGIPLLVVDINRMVKADIPLEMSIPLVFREGLLQNAALYLNGFDLLYNDENEAHSVYSTVMNELASYPEKVFLSGDMAWEPGTSLQGKRFICIEFTMPSYRDRKQLWEKCWSGEMRLTADVDLDDLARKFRLNGGQIFDATAMARNLALWRDPEQGLVTSNDIYSACRQQSRHKLNTLARKLNPKYGWDDIILPRDQMEQLHEICYHVKHHYTVYDDWGFDRKLSLGKGLNVLFSGPSGTGKTMAAEIIGHELGLDIYKIDLSAVVSKYIGETEKNLDHIFHEGQTSNAILFFDEADALFGKRSEVRDSHDRYANVEIAYLLQKMDEYDGIVILATNLKKNMDDAFARRMHFSVEFPVPDVSDRYRIWKGIFPPEAPLSNDIDLHFMAQQFKITGGNIKNIALGAAFMAAEDGGYIRTENLIRATKREYQKLGKLCTEGEFAQYFELVKGENRDNTD